MCLTGTPTHLLLCRGADRTPTGTLPAALAKATTLKVLILKNLALTGTLPPEFGRLTGLQELLIRRNRLSGPVPPSWRGMSSLGHLDVSHNQLTGTLPAGIEAWENLRGLRVSDNAELHGELEMEGQECLLAEASNSKVKLRNQVVRY